jgi:transglutaminase-like putative cysteine protease
MITFERAYRASLYLTLFLATLLLNIDAASDNRLAIFYPIVVAIVAAIAFMTVDLDLRRAIPRDLANFLGLVGFGLGVLEWYNEPTLMMLAIGHTLVYLQIVKFLLPKTVEDDWYLFLMGLVQAVIGVYISQSDQVGVLLLGWGLASLWTFGLFFLRRESLRPDASAGIVITPATDPRDPYPGLLNVAFVLATLRVAAITLVLGVGIFLLMPRWTANVTSRHGRSGGGKHLTGFSETVQLGQMGEILENDSLVMSIEFTDEAGKLITPQPDLLLRGVTMETYSDGEWGRRDDFGSVSGVAISKGAKSPEIRQRVRMEATDSDVLFGIRPILFASGAGGSEILLSKIDGTLNRRDRREFNGDRRSKPGKFDYVVHSRRSGELTQPREVYPENTDRLIQIPGDLEEPLQAYIAPILDKMTATGKLSPSAIANAFRRHLSEGEFTYSLRMTRTDPGLDPVLDFLRNRKEGHCEYFASALTLMCRAAHVPARMVNGFKGGDWNELAGVLNVREKHAHSWVEVLVGKDGNSPVWEMFDPTPSRGRDAVVAQVGSPPFRSLSDFLRNRWAFDVVGFDAERQERKIYGPIRWLASEVRRGAGLLWQAIRDAAQWVVFEDFAAFFSVRGFVVSVGAMLLGAGLLRVGFWLVNRLLGRHGRGDIDPTSNDPGVAFYHRFVRILSAHGLDRPPAETPREFASRAVSFLEGRSETVSPLVGVPSQVVDAFYSKRFGQAEIPPEIVRDLEVRLNDLEVALWGH